MTFTTFVGFVDCCPLPIVKHVTLCHFRGVFTPLAVEYRHERLAAIAEILSEGQHDICFLQEIWTLADFAKMEERMRRSYPYRHYFHSNLIGSGCCIFSKHPIVETFYYRFSLNSFPQRVWHGDWFGGKGVGLAKVSLPRCDPFNAVVYCIN